MQFWQILFPQETGGHQQQDCWFVYHIYISGGSLLGQEDTGFSYAREGLDWAKEEVLHSKGGWALEWTAQGGGGGV